jgi:hypothetical protein
MPPQPVELDSAEGIRCARRFLGGRGRVKCAPPRKQQLLAGDGRPERPD